MRVLIDDTLPAELAQRLQLHNHDVTTVASRPELRGAPDVTVFAVAQREQRAIVTTNALDYLELAGQGEHWGVILTDAGRLVREQTLAQLARDLRQIESCHSRIYTLA